MWRYYTKPNRNWAKGALTQDQMNKMRHESIHEQRAALQLLRMIGSTKIEVLMRQKDILFEHALKFAKFNKPDFILLKESLLAYEKIMIHQIMKQSTEKDPNKKEITVSEADKKHLF